MLLSIVVAGLAGLISQLSAVEPTSTRSSSGDIQVLGDKTMGTPALWFGCDGPTSDLERMFSQPDVISDLQATKADEGEVMNDSAAERRISQLLP